MEPSFCIGIAGLTVELHPLFDYARSFCRDYLTDDAPADITAVSTPETLQAELKTAPNCSANIADVVGLYRQIAECMPAFDGFMFHGAAIEYNGKAYLFTAPSGTGKSTHIRLWQQYLADNVRIVNGDKPLLRLTDDGVNVCSTPWAGKEGWQRNCIVPLGGICLLRRGKDNRITRAQPIAFFDELLHQVYLPKDRLMFDKTLTLVDAVMTRVPFYVLDCTISEEAVRTAFTTLTGGTYDAHS